MGRQVARDAVWHDRTLLPNSQTGADADVGDTGSRKASALASVATSALTARTSSSVHRPDDHNHRAPIIECEDGTRAWRSLLNAWLG
jgi:hypothetical protein